LKVSFVHAVKAITRGHRVGVALIILSNLYARLRPALANTEVKIVPTDSIRLVCTLIVDRFFGKARAQGTVAAVGKPDCSK
jgi:hypothetical protein